MAKKKKGVKKKTGATVRAVSIEPTEPQIAAKSPSQEEQPLQSQSTHDDVPEGHEQTDEDSLKQEELEEELEKEEVEYAEVAVVTEEVTDVPRMVRTEENSKVTEKDTKETNLDLNEGKDIGEMNRGNEFQPDLSNQGRIADDSVSSLAVRPKQEDDAVEVKEPSVSQKISTPKEPTIEAVNSQESGTVETPIASLTQETSLPAEPIEIIEISEGPFSLTPIIKDIPVHNPEIPGFAAPTYVENYCSNIYIGTSSGEILHYVQFEQDYLFVSRNSFHSSRHRPIEKIIVLPNIEKAIVISGGLLSCFSLPEFSPANIGRIKDVWDVSLDHDHKAKDDKTGVHVVVYSTNQIRIINVTPTALRLVKDISYAGTKCGVRRGDFSLVASDKEYDLIDLENLSKIPLFPVQTVENNKEALKPFILPVAKDEFLLTCGTSNDEPSMGLVLNNNGDISRGTVPMDAYPHSVQVLDLLIITAFKNKVVVFSLYDQSAVQEVEFTGKVKVAKLHTAYISPNAKLLDMIRLVPIVGSDDEKEKKEAEFAKGISSVESNLVIYASDFIILLASPPRLQRLQNKTTEELETELKSIDSSDELGVVETEYLSTLIALKHWQKGSYSQCFESLTNGIVDPRILIHVMGYEIYGSVWLFNGLVPLVNELRGRLIKDTKMLEFFTDFLEKWVAKEGFTENLDIIKSIELTNLRMFIHDDMRLKVLLSKPTVLQYEETFVILKEHQKNVALAQYYTSQKDYNQTLKIYKSLVDGELTDQHFDKEAGLLIIIDLLYKHFTHDKEIIKETGLWIMSHNSELGLHFFHNELIDLKDVDEILIISKIDDVSLKYAYLEKLLVRLNKEKTRTNLMKNLRKAELKKISLSVKAQKKTSVGNI